MQNVIAACLAQRVSRLVYVSTYNVIFSDQPIVDGDESMPYVGPHCTTDLYSVSIVLYGGLYPMLMGGVLLSNNPVFIYCSGSVMRDNMM